MYAGSKTAEHIQGRNVHWGLLNMKLLPPMQKVPEIKSTVCCGHPTVPWSCAFSFLPGSVHSWMKPGRNSLTSPGCCIQKHYTTTQQFFVVPEICCRFKTDKLNINYFVILIFCRKHPNGLYEGFTRSLKRHPAQFLAAWLKSVYITWGTCWSLLHVQSFYPTC